MNDPHFVVVRLLEQKEQAIPTQVDVIKDNIKLVADRLRYNSTADYHLDAAFAYYIAGHYVRASRLISQMDISDGVHPVQRWLALILAKNFQVVEDQVQILVVDERYSDLRLQQEILHDGISDVDVLDRILVRKFADILGEFVSFVRCGDEAKLDLIRSGLSKCQRLACKARESYWWWWTECARLIIAEFVTNCLWMQLKPMRQEHDADQVVSKYIVANYGRRRPVVELWRTQVESLDKVNDPERRSFCLAIPTSGGKTRIAELAILRFLLDYPNDPNAKCVYIAPLRKLAGEVEEALAAPLTAVTSNPRAVSSFYGGYEVDLLEQEDLASTRVLIVTPEKLDGMLRHNPGLLPQIRLVIADEGHIIGDDSDRGYKYRMLLERLIYALKIKQVSTEPNRARILFVSGVLPNVDDFAKLITGDRSNKVCLNWRPLDEPLKGSWKWDGNKLVSSNALLPEPVPLRLSGYQSPSIFEEVVAGTALTCALQSRTMVFSASKKAISSEMLIGLLGCLLDQCPLFEEDPLPPGFSRRAEFKQYYALLERGVAIHHSDLPADLKNETETRIYDGRVRLLLASPTLAQGVNIPFDTVLVYRLQHWPGTPIQDAAFWNVVGRVGRPIAVHNNDTPNLCPPRVLFLLNGSPAATKEDRLDIRISRGLINREKRYRVASPFLEFLNKLRLQWAQDTGLPVAELVRSLAERPDLRWITEIRQQKKLSSLLRLLDEHLIALIEEAGVSVEEAEDWLQEASTELVNLLVQVTTIDPEDLDFIKEAVLARATFIAAKIPKLRRRQDYLLGLPLEDCETIRAKQDTLLAWYQRCADIFARQMDSGIDSLVYLLNFVSGLSICKEWRSYQVDPLPMFGLEVPDIDTACRSALFKGWILGEDSATLTPELQRVAPNADWNDYREEMFERNLAWGMSAICRFLSDLAEREGLRLTKDLEYLPSLVKYGVPGKLACHLVGLKIPREVAVKIADLYISRIQSSDTAIPDPARVMDAHEAIISLTDDDVTSLNPSSAVVQRIKEIKAYGISNPA